MSNIIIHGAKEGVLKDITLEIPRNKLVVITGLSGSGKSTLAVDVLFNECQRQYLEAMGMQGIRKPKVDSVRNVSPAIIISQTDVNKNPRSTVGTLTDIYTDLRMVYEKLGVRTCPQCNEIIANGECKEETEKKDGEFTVYMYCSQCNHKMHKLTRTYLSFNTREGACKACQGLGKALTINKDNIILEELTPEEGAVSFWEHRYKDYQIGILYNAFQHYGIPVNPDTPVKNYSPIQKEILYNGVDSKVVKSAFPEITPPKTVSVGKFEGVFRVLWRKLSEAGGESNQWKDYFDYDICPECKGERLNEESRQVTVLNTRIPELTFWSLEELYEWVKKLEASLQKVEYSLVEPYLLDLRTKIQRILNVGLGYLSLDRQAVTLSGGEMQRIRLSATLDSDLTGIIYIMDEPTIGLHPKDTKGMMSVLKGLRDLGNTVILIEHDTDVMDEADYIIDIGPGSGKHGGMVVGKGIIEELKNQETSITGQYLKKKKKIKDSFRQGNGETIQIKNANLHNLKNIDISFPVGCMTAVTGVSGSGKSTLIFDVLGKARDKKSRNIKIDGMEAFNQIVTIEQSAITKMKRSNVATYSEVYTEIRKIYGGLQDAKYKGLSPKHFSFNTPGGRCENCKGLGYVESNMLFFANTEIICPVCQGKQFSDEILSIQYNGFTIKDILQMSVEEALNVFSQFPKIVNILKLLFDVGLGYLELGQSLTTLSGGECQRLKLAKELIQNSGVNNLYLMDEPTTGLHPLDVENFLILLDKIVDSGNTVIVVEHNQQIISASDWIVDLGPEGGNKGGEVVFTGTPVEMLESGKTLTAHAIRDYTF